MLQGFREEEQAGKSNCLREQLYLCFTVMYYNRGQAADEAESENFNQG